MNSLLWTHSDAIALLCARYQVRKLDVFGSASRANGFVPGSSDVDFVVEFEPMSPGAHFDAYFGLQEDLERLLGAPVELVELGAVRNEVFLNSVLSEKQAVYAAA